MPRNASKCPLMRTSETEWRGNNKKLGKNCVDLLAKSLVDKTKHEVDHDQKRFEQHSSSIIGCPTKNLNPDQIIMCLSP